jgi:hypothetical protein
VELSGGEVEVSCMDDVLPEYQLCLLYPEMGNSTLSSAGAAWACVISSATRSRYMTVLRMYDKLYRYYGDKLVYIIN